MLNQIKELREKTGAGMVDCKKALEESGGDMEKAIEFLRKKGIAKSAKREDRDATEGVILLDVNEDGTEGYILEMNSETDFVARNEKFQELAQNILEKIKTEKPTDLENLSKLNLGDGTVEEEVANLGGVIGEKVTIGKFDILTGESVASYSHMGGKIGVLVALNASEKQDLARDTAMQIAATNPKYLIPEDVEEEILEKEKDVYREQLKKEGKPEEMIEKIIPGKMNKYFEEVCLTKQEFIKDDKKKMEEILGETKVVKFIRYSLA